MKIFTHLCTYFGDVPQIKISIVYYVVWCALVITACTHYIDNNTNYYSRRGLHKTFLLSYLRCQPHERVGHY